MTNRFAVAGLVLLAGLSSSGRMEAQGVLQADLEAAFVRQLEHIAGSVDGVVGYVVTDLTTRKPVAARREAEPFPTASTIKLPILYEMLTQKDAGTLDIDTPRPLDKAAVAGGSGVLQFLSTPSLSLLDQATLMIILSDNTSTNVVINAVGMEKVNSRMAAAGLADIRLRRLMMDAEAVKRGDENVASPASLARVAEWLWSGEGLTPASRDAARTILRLVGGRIRAGVPPAVPVFSKTGGLDGVRAEIAVVEVEGRPFSMAVMTTYVADGPDAERAIRDMASAAHAYFDRLARGGAYGRKQ